MRVGKTRERFRNERKKVLKMKVTADSKKDPNFLGSSFKKTIMAARFLRITAFIYFHLLSESLNFFIKQSLRKNCFLNVFFLNFLFC